MTYTEMTIRIFYNFYLATRGSLSIETIRQLYYSWNNYLEWIDEQAKDFESDFQFANESEVVYQLQNLSAQAPVIIASAHLGNMRKGVELVVRYFPVSIIVDQEFYTREQTENKHFIDFYKKKGIEYILAENFSVLNAIKSACKTKRIIFVCIDGNRGYNQDGKGVIKIPFLGRYYLAHKGCFQIAQIARAFIIACFARGKQNDSPYISWKLISEPWNNRIPRNVWITKGMHDCFSFLESLIREDLVQWRFWSRFHQDTIPFENDALVKKRFSLGSIDSHKLAFYDPGSDEIVIESEEE